MVGVIDYRRTKGSNRDAVRPVALIGEHIAHRRPTTRCVIQNYPSQRRIDACLFWDGASRLTARLITGQLPTMGCILGDLVPGGVPRGGAMQPDVGDIVMSAPGRSSSWTTPHPGRG